ncbi:hypothetical protein EST38_g455 [Candolleomyces aberdarensis]|uniref:Uncharacterized protein n=1 Tax=Candolleomyces aberdarensis TaxID=2316362 RepID=A0A4Q2E0L8_9AGAR|nr:hypothetical protein EST38_g455 [Candolleomyces aberdarensis]
MPQQQQLAVPPQGTTARRVQPMHMHVMQVANQQPQTNGSSSTSTFYANRQMNVDIPQHQSYYRPRPDSITSNAQPLDTSSRVMPPPPPSVRTNRSIGHLPEWTDRELAFFKLTMEAWRRAVPVGTSFNISQIYEFGEGYSIRSLADGLYVEDNTDKMKCPIAALYGQLEKRTRPDPGPPQVATTSSLIPQANAQPASVRPLPGPQSNTPSTSVATLNLTSQTPTFTAQSHAVVPVLKSALPAQAVTVTPMSTSTSRLPPSASQGVTVSPATNPASRLPVLAKPTATLVPVTPAAQAQKSLAVHGPVSRSPANANKKTLARDVLFALGKRSRPSNELTPGPAAKRPAIGNLAKITPNGAAVSGVVLNPAPTLPPSIGVFPYGSQLNLPSRPPSAPQSIAGLPSTLKPGEAAGTNQQPSQPPQASESLPVPVTVPASTPPTVAPRLPSPVRPSTPEQIPSSPSLPPIATIDEEEDEKEYDYSYDAQGNKIEDPAERALMEHACTQLQPLPCKWDRCDVVMNSVIGMLSHLKKQHKPVMKDGRAVLKKVKGLFKRSRPPIRLDRYSFLTDYPIRPSCYLSEAAETLKVADMDWSVRLTELCRQDRVTILDEGSRRAVIAPSPEPEVKEEDEEQTRFESPESELGLIDLEARSSSREPVEQNQTLFEQEEGGYDDDDGEDTESEVYSVGAGVDDDDEGEEAGESDMVASLLL